MEPSHAADLLQDPASYKPVALSSQCPCARWLHEAKERKERGECSWLLPCGREHVQAGNAASHYCGPSPFLPFQFHILASRMKMSCYFSSNTYIKYTSPTHTHMHCSCYGNHPWASPVFYSIKISPSHPLQVLLPVRGWTLMAVSKTVDWFSCCYSLTKL